MSSEREVILFMLQEAEKRTRKALQYPTTTKEDHRRIHSGEEQLSPLVPPDWFSFCHTIGLVVTANEAREAFIDCLITENFDTEAVTKLCREVVMISKSSTTSTVKNEPLKQSSAANGEWCLGCMITAGCILTSPGYDNEIVALFRHSFLCLGGRTESLHEYDKIVSENPDWKSWPSFKPPKNNMMAYSDDS